MALILASCVGSDSLRRTEPEEERRRMKHFADPSPPRQGSSSMCKAFFCQMLPGPVAIETVPVGGLDWDHSAECITNIGTIIEWWWPPRDAGWWTVVTADQ